MNVYEIFRFIMLSWISVSCIVEQILEKVVIIPDGEEYFMNKPLWQVVFKSGATYGYMISIVVSAFNWQQIIQRRYAYRIDFQYLFFLRFCSQYLVTIFYFLLIYCVEIINIKQLIRYSFNIYNVTSYIPKNYQVVVSDFQFFILTLISYSLCKRKKVNVHKAFKAIISIQFLVRCLIIIYLSNQNKLHIQQYRIYYDQHVLLGSYIYMIAFLVSSQTYKFSVQKTMLFNIPLKTSSSIFKKCITYVLFVIITLVTFMMLYCEASLTLNCQNQQCYLKHKYQLIFAKMFLPLFCTADGIILHFVLQGVQQYINMLQSHNKQKYLQQNNQQYNPDESCCRSSTKTLTTFVCSSYQNEQQTINPDLIAFTSQNTLNDKQKLTYSNDYSEKLFFVLSSELLNDIFLNLVQNQTLGPFYVRLYVFLTVGILVMQYFIGVVVFMLTKWIFISVVQFVIEIFDRNKAEIVTRYYNEKQQLVNDTQQNLFEWQKAEQSKVTDKESSQVIM